MPKDIFTQLQPSLNTPFVIDWSWFEAQGIDTRMKRSAQLCYQCRAQFGNRPPEGEVDWVDPTSGEVFRVDPVAEAIMSHCQWKPDYISTTTPLLTGVFRALLANNNRPMTAIQLAQRLGRTDPDTVLQVLRRGETRNGIVPQDRISRPNP